VTGREFVADRPSGGAVASFPEAPAGRDPGRPAAWGPARVVAARPVVLVVLEVRANRRGSSVLTGQDHRSGSGSGRRARDR
jgi:hypothetical protein